MHLRGEDFAYPTIYPVGESETLLSVPHYEFSGQLVYRPIAELTMTKGPKV